MRNHNQLTLASLGMPAVAAAHGIDAAAGGFLAGIAHTLSGPDHCLVGLGLGVWIALALRRGFVRRPHAVWLAVVVTLFGMAHGYAMAAGAAYALGAGLTLLGVFVAGALAVRLTGIGVPRRVR